MNRLSLAIISIGLAFLAGCGGGGVSISLSPGSATVAPGATQQFTASVHGGGGNSNVTWQVNSIIGGDTTVGTITSDGLYTAPAVIPSSPTVTITAVPSADTMKTATATVTIADPIKVSPTSATVSVTASQQFSATVTFSSDTSVTWQVNGVTGGNSTYGTISTTGSYTAPASVPSPSSVTVTAVSQADSSKTATASVVITPPPIVIAPSDVTLPAGAQQGFTATVLQKNVSPKWTLTCNSTNSADCGTLTSDGIYTAPLAPPSGGTVTITATMADGSAQSASITVPIQISDATLAGTYVFGLANRSTASFAAEAGIISFDGVGKITGGQFDRAGTGAGSITITGGTYDIGTDGRGTAILETDDGPIAWQFVIGTRSTAQIARLQADGYALTGRLDLQQSSAATPLAGKFALNTTGVASSDFTATAGAVAFDGVATVTRVLLDAVSGSDVKTNLSGTGAYTTASSSGRGALTISTGAGSQSFVYYAVDSSHVKMVETDGNQLAYGELYQQGSANYTAASFNERVAFTVSGLDSGATYAAGGLFILDGNSAITNRILDGSSETVFDTNGVYLLTDSTFGRTTAKWTSSDGSTSQYVLYPRAGGSFVMLEVDGAHAAGGIAMQQTLASPSTASLTGQYALALQGTDLNDASPVAFTGSADITQAGAWSGTLDSADKNGTTLGAESQVGSFMVATTGRGVVTLLSTSPALNGSTIILYVLDGDNFLALESDSNRVLVGSAIRQY